MLGGFNPVLGKIWTNLNFGLKMSFKMLTQLLGLSIFDHNPAFFRVRKQHELLNQLSVLLMSKTHLAKLFEKV